MKNLSNKEIRSLNERISRFGLEIGKKQTVVEDEGRYTVDGTLWFFVQDGNIMPTIKLLLSRDLTLPKITVDMGAVKFVAGGADVMRPGIVAIPDGIAEGDVVAIIDENNRKPLCVGTAMYSSTEMQGMTTGKVVKNVHHVGDGIWNS